MRRELLNNRAARGSAGRTFLTGISPGQATIDVETGFTVTVTSATSGAKVVKYDPKAAIGVVKLDSAGGQTIKFDGVCSYPTDQWERTSPGSGEMTWEFEKKDSGSEDTNPDPDPKAEKTPRPPTPETKTIKVKAYASGFRLYFADTPDNEDDDYFFISNLTAGGGGSGSEVDQSRYSNRLLS